LILRWQCIDGSNRIAVDWRDGAGQHRTICVVELDGASIAHVKGVPLGDDDHDALTDDIRTFCAYVGADSSNSPSQYYAGHVAAGAL